MGDSIGVSGADRGVSTVVGFIFIVAILMILLSINQAQVVPAENSQIEYRHSQAVLGDLQELRNGILTAAGSGSTAPVSIQLGTQYPSRVFAVNPAPASGHLHTAAVGTPPNVTISNAIAATNEETRDYWNGDDRSFETRSIVYEPSYNAYTGAPNATIYENSLLYKRFDNGASIAETDQVILQNHTITLVAISGSLGESGSGSVSVDPRAISGPYREITIENDDPGPIEIAIPSSIGRSAFVNLTDLPAYASVSDGTGDHLLLSLDPGPYTLRMANVGVGSGATEEEPAYVTSVDGLPDQVRTGSAHEIRVAVNDRFNNPVSGVLVNASASAGSVDAAQKRTDEDGIASFTYTAPNSPGPDSVDLTIFDGVPETERVSEDTTVTAGGNGGPPPETVGSTVVDQGQTGSLARYEVSFDATGVSDYNRTEVTIQNLDAGWADATYVSTNERDNLDDYGWVDTFGGTGGDSYEITMTVYDDAGTVVDSRTVTDVADGVDPGGNDDLSESDSPTLDSAQLSEVDQYTVEYELDYAVSDPSGTFSEVEVLFVNTDSPYATDEVTGTSLAETVSYSGYSMGDRYVVYVQVQDDDGIVVDRAIINDTAGQILEVDRSVPVQSGNRLQFDIRNTGDSMATITDFALDATPIDNNVFIDNGAGNELEIRGGFWATGAANRDPGEFAADGTQYNLFTDSNNGGQYAYLLEDDDDVTVEFREFTGPGASDRSLDDLVVADSAADADVTVTLSLSGAGPQELYFKQE